MLVETLDKRWVVYIHRQGTWERESFYTPAKESPNGFVAETSRPAHLVYNGHLLSFRYPESRERDMHNEAEWLVDRDVAVKYAEEVMVIAMLEM